MPRNYASRPRFNGKQVLLDGDLSLVQYQNGITPIAAFKIYTDSTTTNSSGQVSWNLPNGLFTAIHSVQAQVVRNTADPGLGAFCMIRTYGTGQINGIVFESKTSGVLLGGVVEGLEASPTAGIVVMLMVIGI